MLILVFSTKQRQPWVSDAHRGELYAYQAGIYQEWESPAIVIGGAVDHVHALFDLSKNHPLSKVVEEEHHRKMTFQNEFRALCRRHGIALDERYVWE